jgi:hypothetical protein
MPTGYVVSGRGDLDGLFKPRSSAAAANTNFRSNGGVDLAQRFEPRGATAAIAATGFKSGATDLAQIFMDVAASTSIYSMVAGFTSGQTGYLNNTSIAIGTWSPTRVWKAGINVEGLYYTDPLSTSFRLYSPGSATPPGDDDSVFARVEVTGIFSDSGGAPVTRTLARTARSTTATGTGGPSGTDGIRIWQWNPLARFINGNSYTVTIF